MPVVSQMSDMKISYKLKNVNFYSKVKQVLSPYKRREYPQQPSAKDISLEIHRKYRTNACRFSSQECQVKVCNT